MIRFIDGALTSPSVCAVIAANARVPMLHSVPAAQSFQRCGVTPTPKTKQDTVLVNRGETEIHQNQTQENNLLLTRIGAFESGGLSLKYECLYCLGFYLTLMADIPKTVPYILSFHYY